MNVRGGNKRYSQTTEQFRNRLMFLFNRKKKPHCGGDV